MKLEDKIISSPEEMQADADKLVRFISVYCKVQHGKNKKLPFTYNYSRLPVNVKETPDLCAECTKLLRHAIVMRVLCPLDPKPKCRRCPQHCYRPKYRDEMEKVMKYVGPRSLFKRG